MGGRRGSYSISGRNGISFRDLQVTRDTLKDVTEDDFGENLRSDP